MDLVLKQPETDQEFEDYFKLRWRLLRKPWGEPRGSELDELDNATQQRLCYHLMAIDSDTCIGVARLQLNSETQAQIRYMAVDEHYRNNGTGRMMIKSLEQYAKEHCINKIILDAREPAVGFYEKLGYSVTEKSYLLFNEIQHFIMVKSLHP